jgi:ribonuclease P protein component
MSNPRPHTFPKAQRLKSRNQIEALFRSGKSFSVFPLKVLYRWEGEELPKVGVGAPKRFFKRAVDRNRIKRLLREAYRLQKQILLESSSAKGLHVFLIYTGRDLPSLPDVMQRIGVILRKLQGLARPAEPPPKSGSPLKSGTPPESGSPPESGTPPESK